MWMSLKWSLFSRDVLNEGGYSTLVSFFLNRSILLKKNKAVEAMSI